MTMNMTSAMEGRNQKIFDGLLEVIYKNFHYNPRPLWERAGERVSEEIDYSQVSLALYGRGQGEGVGNSLSTFFSPFRRGSFNTTHHNCCQYCLSPSKYLMIPKSQN